MFSRFSEGEDLVRDRKGRARASLVYYNNKMISNYTLSLSHLGAVPAILTLVTAALLIAICSSHSHSSFIVRAINFRHSHSSFVVD